MRHLAMILVGANLWFALPARAQDAQTREIAERVGLTAPQARTLLGRVDRYREQIDALSRANQIQFRALRAIALELGARNPNLPEEQFVALIRESAARAAETRRKFDQLTTTIAAIDPGGDRTRAVALMAKARTAFDEGRLREAEATFGELAFLRASSVDGVRQAWIEAVDLEAQSAALRGDTERAEAVRRAKIAEMRRQREARALADLEEEWRTLQAVAADWQNRGMWLAQGEAIQRAIRIYREEVLPAAPRNSMPVNWAATQNDLGNALVRLAAFERGTTRLEDAVAAFELALEERSRAREPFEWATTQNNLGTALKALGERERGTARLEAAIAAYRLALEEWSRERWPLQWAMAQNNLGNALTVLGDRESGTARIEEAVAAYRLALEERSRARMPLDWAMTQVNLANALRTLGERERGTARLEESVAAFRLALDEFSRPEMPLHWATAQHNLGAALTILGRRVRGTTQLEQAVAAYRLALEERTRDRVPLAWAATQNDLGNALRALGDREDGSARLEEAVAAYHLALEERPRERTPLDWAATQYNLGDALQMLGAHRGGTSQLEEAIAAYRLALEEYSRDRLPKYWAQSMLGRAGALAILADRTGNAAKMAEARRDLSDVRTVAVGVGANNIVEAADRLLSLTDEPTPPPASN